MTIVVATFYKFVRLPEFAAKQAELLDFCLQQGIKGTVLLAQEGINGTIAGSRTAIDAVLDKLRSDPCLTDLEVKESWAETPPFDRMKVRLKTEIVTLGLPEIDPTDQVGIYVAPQDWNTLIADPTVTVIDTRNQYEVNIGTFQRAQNPQTASFREFPAYVQTHLNPEREQKVALFCTGGIRCEKASAYLLAQGFKQVYHLQGGILKYLETVPADSSLWQGECFVFDQRVAVTHGLAPGSYESCRACGYPVSPADQASPKYQAGVCCPHCFELGEGESEKFEPEEFGTGETD